MLSKDPNLAHHGLAHMWIFFLALLKLLYRHYAPRLPLLRLEHLAVGALADHLQNPVLVHTQRKLYLLHGAIKANQSLLRANKGTS